MKSKDPLISIILKGFAIIAGLLSFWRFVTAFIAPETFIQGTGVTVSQAGIYSAQAGGFVAAALSLWWMAEIIALLARIASNTERQSSGAVPSAAPARSPSTPVTASSISSARPEDPPKYQL